MDKEDDALVGIKSTALRLGSATRYWLFGFYGGTIGLLAVAGMLAALEPAYFVVLAVAFLHLLWQGIWVNFDDPESCLATFKSNRNFGLIVLGGIVLAQVAF